MSWVRGYKIPFKAEPIQEHIPINKCNSQSETQIIENCISELLDSGFISPCSPCDYQFISPIFTVPKPNGKHRFILNLKTLNKFIQVEHFKMEDYRTALKLLCHNYYMTTLDLKDAYFLLPVDFEDRKKLRFLWNSNFFEFNVLPFGLCTAPFVFTKLLKPILQYLRSSGYMSVNYLDDFLCIGSTYEQCVTNVTVTKKVLESLGFLINWNKSQLIPSKLCKFLGFMFNTTDVSIFLPGDKKNRIKKQAEKMLHTSKCSIRHFAKFLGLLTSACPAVCYGWAYTKLLEREKYLALGNSNNYNKRMYLRPHLAQDLRWWRDNINSSMSPMHRNDYLLEIYTDASRSGWGAVCKSEVGSGSWSTSQLSYHINFLELQAAFYGLKIFGSHLSNCNILLRIDNTTAIAYINRMGGVQFTHLNELARQIWKWCENRSVYIFASYIKSSDNIDADCASRQLSIDTEWELADFAFTQINKNFGLPDFDLFASIQNHKCERYASWKLDPQSEIIDAFTFNWKNIYFYAFPPFCLVAKVLQKIISDKATGILVVPYWPTQPWWPLFRELLIAKELVFNPNPSLLHSPFREAHPLSANLSLVAAKLSGRR